MSGFRTCSVYIYIYVIREKKTVCFAFPPPRLVALQQERRETEDGPRAPSGAGEAERCVSLLRVVYTRASPQCQPHERTWPAAVPKSFSGALHKVQAKAWQPPPPPPFLLPWHRGCVTCQGFGTGFRRAGRRDVLYE